MSSPIPIRLRGYVAVTDPAYGRYLNAREKVREFNPETKKHEYRYRSVPLYRTLDNGQIGFSFGLVLYHARTEGGLKFQVTGRSGDIPFQALDFASPAIQSLALDEWQTRATQIAATTRGGLFEAPTGSGKSRPQAALSIAAAAQHNVLFVEFGETVRDNYLSTMEKIPEEYRSGYELVPYDRYRRNPGAYPDRGIIIHAGPKAVLNDYLNHGQTLDTVGTMISDEVHHGESATYQTMIYALPHLVRSYGFSATIFEGNADRDFQALSVGDASIIAAHGPLLLRVKPADVQHRIDLPDVLNLRVPWLPDSYRTTNWRSIYGIVKRHPVRRQVICDVLNMIVEIGRVSTVPVGDKAYGRSLMEQAQNPKICCWYGGGEAWDLNGGFTATIEDMKQMIEDGKYSVLIVTSHVDESLDIPAIDTPFLTEGKRARRARQRAGRGVRRGKERKAVVINLWDVDGRVLQSQASFRCNSLIKYYETQKYRFDSVAALKDYLVALDE